MLGTEPQPRLVTQQGTRGPHGAVPRGSGCSPAGLRRSQTLPLSSPWCSSWKTRFGNQLGKGPLSLGSYSTRSSVLCLVGLCPSAANRAVSGAAILTWGLMRCAMLGSFQGKCRDFNQASRASPPRGLPEFIATRAITVAFLHSPNVSESRAPALSEGDKSLARSRAAEPVTAPIGEQGWSCGRCTFAEGPVLRCCVRGGSQGCLPGDRDPGALGPVLQRACRRGDSAGRMHGGKSKALCNCSAAWSVFPSPSPANCKQNKTEPQGLLKRRQSGCLGRPGTGWASCSRAQL